MPFFWQLLLVHAGIVSQEVDDTMSGGVSDHQLGKRNQFCNYFLCLKVVTTDLAWTLVVQLVQTKWSKPVSSVYRLPSSRGEFSCQSKSCYALLCIMC